MYRVSTLETYFSTFRANIIGQQVYFDTPFGRKRMLYADWTSGRAYRQMRWSCWIGCCLFLGIRIRRRVLRGRGCRRRMKGRNGSSRSMCTQGRRMCCYSVAAGDIHGQQTAKDAGVEGWCADSGGGAAACVGDAYGAPQQPYQLAGDECYGGGDPA